MAENVENKEFPWKSGMWYNKDQCGFLTCVNGDVAEYKNVMVLDYPKVWFIRLTSFFWNIKVR